MSMCVAFEFVIESLKVQKTTYICIMIKRVCTVLWPTFTMGRRSVRAEEMLTGCSLTCFIIVYKFTFIELVIYVLFFIEPE